MDSDALSALAREACRAIVSEVGKGQIVATVRKVEPGLLVHSSEFPAGADDVAEFARSVKARGIRRFMVQSAPEGTAVVTEDGVSVRASSYVDTQGQEWVRLSAWGRGAKA